MAASSTTMNMEYFGIIILIITVFLIVLAGTIAVYFGGAVSRFIGRMSNKIFNKGQ